MCLSLVYHHSESSCSVYAVGGVTGPAPSRTQATETELPQMAVSAFGHDWYNRISTGGDVGSCASRSRVEPLSIAGSLPPAPAPPTLVNLSQSDFDMVPW
jgi:hypothetical protein